MAEINRTPARGTTPLTQTGALVKTAKLDAPPSIGRTHATRVRDSC